MQKIFAAAVALLGAASVAATGSASAADLRARPVYKAAPMLPPASVPISWSRCYVGANAGGTFSNSNSVDTVAVPSYYVVDPNVFVNNNGDPNGSYWASNSAAGASGNVGVGRPDHFIGGGQIGCNYQYSSSFVVGVEADIQGIAGGSSGSATNSRSLPLFWLYDDGNGGQVPDRMTTTISVTKKLDYLGTLRGRVGILATPTMLAYGTGGLAYGRFHASTSIMQTNTDQANTLAFSPGDAFENPTASSFGSRSEMRVGWTLGGGLEWMLGSNWTVKAEYLYYDLGSVTYALSPLVTTNTVPNEGPTSIVNAQSTTRANGSIVRFGLNYLFN